MNPEQEIEKKVQELQILEQNLQGLLVQKQSVQIELNEILNALAEIGKSDGEVYKIVGGVMIKSQKEKISSELAEKKKLFELRVSSVEKQELLLDKKADELKKEISASLNKKNLNFSAV